jgi:hypothetical protein
MAHLLTAKKLLAAAFIMIGVVMLRVTYTAEKGFLADSVGMGPMTYPRYLLFGWLAASALYFIFPDTRETENIKESIRPVLIAAGMIAGYVVMFFYLGLFMSTSIFLLAFFYVEGYRDLKVGIFTALLGAFVFWFVFEKQLQVPMPEGIFGF